MAQHADFPGQLGISGDDCPAIAVGTQVFARIEAESGSIAQAADPPALVPGAVCLGPVLQDKEVVLPADAEDGLHLSRTAVEMDGYDRGCAWRDRCLKGRWIQSVSSRVDVRKDRDGTRSRHGQGGEGRRQGWHDHLVACPNACCPQAKFQGIGPTPHTYCVGHLAIGRPLGLESLSLLTKDKPATVEDPLDGAIDLRANVLVFSFQISQRDGRWHALSRL